MSEPSNRNTAAGSWRILADCWSIGETRFAGSSSLLALTQPPPVVAFALALAQSGEARKAAKALTSGASRNVATNSPPPRTGFDEESTAGR